MDSESFTKTKNEEDKQNQNCNNFSDAGNVPESIRIRRTTGDLNTVDRFLLECELGIVLPCGILLFTLFLLLR
jgi:hypothetical protein